MQTLKGPFSKLRRSCELRFGERTAREQNFENLMWIFENLTWISSFWSQNFKLIVLEAQKELSAQILLTEASHSKVWKSGLDFGKSYVDFDLFWSFCSWEWIVDLQKLEMTLRRSRDLGREISLNSAKHEQEHAENKQRVIQNKHDYNIFSCGQYFPDFWRLLPSRSQQWKNKHPKICKQTKMWTLGQAEDVARKSDSNFIENKIPNLASTLVWCR